MSETEELARLLHETWLATTTNPLADKRNDWGRLRQDTRDDYLKVAAKVLEQYQRKPRP